MSIFAVNDEHFIHATHEGLEQARFETRCSLSHYPKTTVDDAELCVSEAFSNALKHTHSGKRQGRVTLRIYALPRAPLYIDLIDQGPIRPDDRPRVVLRPLELDLDAENGRGMLLISQLTRHWTYVRGRTTGTLCMIFDAPTVQTVNTTA